MKLSFGLPLASIALCLLLGSCAQTGPPLPPSLELPKTPTDLRAIRKGNHVTLTWSEPTLTTDRQSVRYLGPTIICRSAETEINVCGNPVGTVPAPPSVPQKPPSPRGAQKPTSPRPAPQAYIDTLPENLQKKDPAAEVTYAVEVWNRNARGAGLSNRVRVPAVVTLPPPRDLSVEVKGEGMELNWTSAGELKNVFAGSAANSPSMQVHYRIYRRDEATGKDTIAGEIPVERRGPTHFVDTGFEWEKTYFYHVTSVNIIKRPESEVQVEGEDTPAIRVVAHDVFPPYVPTGLQAVYSGEGQKPFIDLVWAPVTNADLAGYNIYRGEGHAAAVKLNSDLVKSPSYRDNTVESGKSYTYSVSAVDVRGNESERSDETGETVP